MSNKMYSQVEMLAEVKEKKHIATKEYVDNILNARLMPGVECVVIENIDGTYDPTAKSLTTSGAINSDDVSLIENMEVLLIAQTDKSQNGRYVVETMGVPGVESSATVSVAGTGVTNATIDVAQFETKLAVSSQYVFIYDGTTDNAWKYDGNVVTLSDYGITEESTGAVDGDTITVDYTAAVAGTDTVFVRSELMSDSAQLFSGMLIPVHQGTAYGDTIFQLINDTTMTLDTTPLVFEKYICGEQGAAKFTYAIIGDDATKEWDITHGLGTKEVAIKVFESATGKEAFFETAVVTENMVKVSSDVVLTPTDKFDVVVIG